MLYQLSYTREFPSTALPPFRLTAPPNMVGVGFEPT